MSPLGSCLECSSLNLWNYIEACGSFRRLCMDGKNKLLGMSLWCFCHCVFKPDFIFLKLLSNHNLLHVSSISLIWEIQIFLKACAMLYLFSKMMLLCFFKVMRSKTKTKVSNKLRIPVLYSTCHWLSWYWGWSSYSFLSINNSAF